MLKPTVENCEIASASESKLENGADLFMSRELPVMQAV
jgi:hypothetical protein